MRQSHFIDTLFSPVDVATNCDNPASLVTDLERWTLSIDTTSPHYMEVLCRNVCCSVYLRRQTSGRQTATESSKTDVVL